MSPNVTTQPLRAASASPSEIDMAQKTAKIAGQAMSYSAKGIKGSGVVADRRLVSSAATTAAPSAATDGFEAGGQSEIAMLLKCNGGTSAGFKLYRYFGSIEEWVEATDVGETTVLAGNTGLVNARLFGCDRFYVQISTETGVTTSMQAWAELRSE